MSITQTRTSWDTRFKLLFATGLDSYLPKEVIKDIPASNISTWRKIAADKFEGYQYLKQDIEFALSIKDYPNLEKFNKAYIKIAKCFKSIFKEKDYAKLIRKNKEKVVSTVEALKDQISIPDAISIFGISRATYQNYKIQILNKCDASYIYWCLKRYPQQLLYQEIIKIKEYFSKQEYQFWSKSSLYYAGVRKGDFSFGLSTFYKYANLLGFQERNCLRKAKKFKPLVSYKPNQIWCADVTIYKTKDGVKHYIHLLVDHFSRKTLGWQIATSAQPRIIKELLRTAFEQLDSNQKIQFVTDNGVENVNKTVERYVVSTNNRITHSLAQNTIPESNSVIESIFKVLKNQFLRPLELENSKQLHTVFPEIITTYDTIRPQHFLKGNTPEETYNNLPVIQPDFKKAVKHRIAQNQLNRCKICLS